MQIAVRHCRTETCWAFPPLRPVRLRSHAWRQPERFMRRTNRNPFFAPTALRPKPNSSSWRSAANVTRNLRPGGVSEQILLIQIGESSFAVSHSLDRGSGRSDAWGEQTPDRPERMFEPCAGAWAVERISAVGNSHFRPVAPAHSFYSANRKAFKLSDPKKNESQSELKISCSISNTASVSWVLHSTHACGRDLLPAGDPSTTRQVPLALGITREVLENCSGRGVCSLPPKRWFRLLSTHRTRSTRTCRTDIDTSRARWSRDARHRGQRDGTWSQS